MKGCVRLMVSKGGSVLFSSTCLTVGRHTVRVAFTGVEAGNLGLHVGREKVAVLENRARLADRLGLPRSGFTYLNQVHGVEVFDADAGVLPEILDFTVGEAAEVEALAPVADAAVSCSGQPLAVMVADCIPLVLVGRQSGSGEPVLAVAHAGRRGLLDGVIQQTVGEMVGRGAEEIRVWIGPSVCGRCYEVPQQMRQESSAILPQVYAETSWGTPALDLPAGARAVLENLPSVVEVKSELAACTLETEELFSHRRGQPQGRFAGLVWVEED